jgi:hypothetical protein
MVRVRITQPSLRAVIADSPRSKKIQIWPPFPERERSRAAGTLKSRHVSRNARESYSHVLLSKSAARKKHVSSERRGYRPTVFLAQEVVLDYGVGQRDELPRLPVDLLPLLRAASVDRLPIRHDRRHVSVSAITFLPSPSVYIFSPAKQASKQCDSLSGPLLLVHRRRCLNSFGKRRILWRKLRNRNAVNRQEPPQASVSPREDECFSCSRGSKGRDSEPFSLMPSQNGAERLYWPGRLRESTISATLTCFCHCFRSFV